MSTEGGTEQGIIIIPKTLLKKVEEKGIDIEDFIINALFKELKLDPLEAAVVRFERAKEFLREAKTYLERGDPVQASEKMYKTVEECIKLLAQLYGLPEYDRALKEGRWWTQLLGKVARRIASRLNEPKVADVWARAYDVHVWGFHEAKYNIDDIKDDLEYVKWLLEFTEKLIKNKKKER